MYIKMKSLHKRKAVIALNEINDSILEYKFWISRFYRYVSFNKENDFEEISSDNLDDMWTRIYGFIEDGYKIK